MTTEKPILVFISGPYAKPDPTANVRRAIAYADTILQMGLVPFVPHLTHLWEQHSPKPYADWLAYDMHWLRLCDVVFRFDGESKGADLEVAEAKRLGIPVVTEIAGLVPFIKRRTTCANPVLAKMVKHWRAGNWTREQFVKACRSLLILNPGLATGTQGTR